MSSDFEIGDTVDIEDLSEADARAIFGDPFYESWLAMKADPRPRGVARVVSIDSGCTLTFDEVLP